MLRGFWHLTWLEIKIFVREPLGVFGTVGIPVLFFILFGRAFGNRAETSEAATRILNDAVPIFISVFIALSAALSLAAVMSIYREGGILKRLRATPLRPATILGAHVLVKLVFSALTLALMALAGRRFYPVALDGNFPGLALAVIISTMSILTIGFVIASVVPTARFAQPLGAAVLYPMLAISGLFAPLETLPRGWAALGSVLPLTHAVALMRGAWVGAPWIDLLPHVGVLVLTMVICVALSSRIFRWE